MDGESETGLDFAPKGEVSRDQGTDAIVSRNASSRPCRAGPQPSPRSAPRRFDETEFRGATDDGGPDAHDGPVLLTGSQTEGTVPLSATMQRHSAAADKAKELALERASAISCLLDFTICYNALIVAALYENASADEQTRWARTS